MKNSCGSMYKSVLIGLLIGSFSATVSYIVMSEARKNKFFMYKPYTKKAKKALNDMMESIHNIM